MIEQANETPKPKARRGFAAMSPERQLAIARKGGASVPDSKRSFAKDKALAIAAGRKGGKASNGGGRKPAVISANPTNLVG